MEDLRKTQNEEKIKGLQTKLESAESKREKELEKKLEGVRKNVIFCFEMVFFFGGDGYFCYGQ